MKKIVLKLREIVDKVFGVGVLIKAVFGFFEILGGVILLFSGKLLLDNFIINLAQQEIEEDFNDLIANFLINSANNLYYDAHVFAIIYLLAHGLINVFLAIFLLKNKIWAYPWAIASFSSFAAYQVYRYLHTFSASLLLLSVFDIFLIGIIWLEWNRKKIKTKIEIAVD